MTLCSTLIFEQSGWSTFVPPPNLLPLHSLKGREHHMTLTCYHLRDNCCVNCCRSHKEKKETHTHNLEACWAGSHWLAMGFLEAVGPNPWSKGSAGPLATGRRWDILHSLGCHALRKTLKWMLPKQQIHIVLRRP